MVFQQVQQQVLVPLDQPLAVILPVLRLLVGMKEYDKAEELNAQADALEESQKGGNDDKLLEIMEKEEGKLRVTQQ